MVFLVVFFWGVAAAAGQVFIMREYLVATGGNELVIGFFLFSWLLGIATGALAAGHAVERRAVASGIALNLASVAAIATAMAAARLANNLFSIPGGVRLSILQCASLAAFTVFPAAAVVGALFPVASILASRRGNGGLNPAGSAYWMEGAGMASGSLLATFVLVPFASPTQAVLLAFAPSSVFLAFTGGTRRVWKWVSLTGAAILLAAALIGTAPALDTTTASMRFESLKTGFARIGSLDTAYAHYDLAESRGEFALFSGGHFTVSFPDTYSNAPRAHLFMVEAGEPKNVLIVGSASFGLLPHVLKHKVESVDYLETDPALVPFLEKASGRTLIPADPRLHSISGDGRAFLRNARRGFYDLIICDTPDPSTIMLNRFYTEEFFRDAASALSKRGIFSIGAGTAVTRPGEASAAQAGGVYTALKSAFETVLPAYGDRFYLIAAKPEALPTGDWGELARRYKVSGAVDASFPPETLESFFPEGRAAELESLFAKAGGGRANTDLRPSSYFYNLILWNWTAGGGAPRLLQRLPEYGAVASAFLIVMISGIAVFFSVRSGRRTEWAASSVLAAAGFFGIGAEVVFFMEFQNAVGALYSQVGLLLAAYMAGMTAGAAAGQRFSPVSAAPAGLALLAGAAFAASIPLLLGTLPNGGIVPVVAIPALAGLAGALSGMVFPLASSAMKGGTGTAMYAGRADALDSAGAAAGAIMISVAILPASGISGAAAVTALACALPGIWAVAVRFKK